jgi:hypothetical protein
MYVNPKISKKSPRLKIMFILPIFSIRLQNENNVYLPSDKNSTIQWSTLVHC